MGEEHQHTWARVQGIPGTRSFEIVCTVCHKPALEIRPKVAPLSEWGWIAKTYSEFIQTSREEETHG